jgi:hypothetical protein
MSDDTKPITPGKQGFDEIERIDDPLPDNATEAERAYRYQTRRKNDPLACDA